MAENSSNDNTSELSEDLHVGTQNFNDINSRMVSNAVARQNYESGFSDAKLAELKKAVYKMVSSWLYEDKIRIISEYGDADYLSKNPSEKELNKQLTETIITHLPPQDLRTILMDVKTTERKVRKDVQAAQRNRDKAGTSFRAENTINTIVQNQNKPAEERTKKDDKENQKALEKTIKELHVPKKVKGLFPRLRKCLEKVFAECFSTGDILGYAQSMDISADGRGVKDVEKDIIDKTILFAAIVSGKYKGFDALGLINDPDPFKQLLKYTPYAYLTGEPGISPTEWKSLQDAARRGKAQIAIRTKMMRQRAWRGSAAFANVAGEKNLTSSAIKANDIGILKDKSFDELITLAGVYGVKVNKRQDIGKLKLELYKAIAANNNKTSSLTRRIDKSLSNGVGPSKALTDERSIRTEIAGLSSKKAALTSNMSSQVPLVSFAIDGTITDTNITKAVPVYVVNGETAGATIMSGPKSSLAGLQMGNTPKAGETYKTRTTELGKKDAALLSLFFSEPNDFLYNKVLETEQDAHLPFNTLERLKNLTVVDSNVVSNQTRAEIAYYYACFRGHPNIMIYLEKYYDFKVRDNRGSITKAYVKAKDTILGALNSGWRQAAYRFHTYDGRRATANGRYKEQNKSAATKFNELSDGEKDKFREYMNAFRDYPDAFFTDLKSMFAEFPRKDSEHLALDDLRNMIASSDPSIKQAGYYYGVMLYAQMERERRIAKYCVKNSGLTSYRGIDLFKLENWELSLKGKKKITTDKKGFSKFKGRWYKPFEVARKAISRFFGSYSKDEIDTTPADIRKPAGAIDAAAVPKTNIILDNPTGPSLILPLEAGGANIAPAQPVLQTLAVAQTSQAQPVAQAKPAVIPQKASKAQKQLLQRTENQIIKNVSVSNDSRELLKKALKTGASRVIDMAPIAADKAKISAAGGANIDHYLDMPAQPVYLPDKQLDFFTGLKKELNNSINGLTQSVNSNFSVIYSGLSSDIITLAAPMGTGGATVIRPGFLIGKTKAEITKTLNNAAVNANAIKSAMSTGTPIYANTGGEITRFASGGTSAIAGDASGSNIFANGAKPELVQSTGNITVTPLNKAGTTTKQKITRMTTNERSQALATGISSHVIRLSYNLPSGAVDVSNPNEAIKVYNVKPGITDSISIGNGQSVSLLSLVANIYSALNNLVSAETTGNTLLTTISANTSKIGAQTSSSSGTTQNPFAGGFPTTLDNILEGE